MSREHTNRFSSWLRHRVRQEQNYTCALCGASDHLQIHHIRPRSDGGRATRANAIGVDPTCHEYLDELALQHGITYDMIAGLDYYVGLPKKDA